MMTYNTLAKYDETFDYMEPQPLMLSDPAQS